MNPVQITVDGRETRVAEELDKIGVSFVRKELNPGDFLFTRGEDALLICERKTYPDLSSSIASGRYAEQRERLRETGAKILYIIEGPNVARTELDGKRTLGALENLAIKHGIAILPTASASQTALSLKNIQKKLQEQETRSGDEAIAPKIIQRKQKIMANVLLHQLQVITGVSGEIAKSITVRYPTMRALIDAYTASTSEETRRKLLEDLPVGKRRVGPAVSQRIYQALHGDI